MFAKDYMNIYEALPKTEMLAYDEIADFLNSQYFWIVIKTKQYRVVSLSIS